MERTCSLVPTDTSWSSSCAENPTPACLSHTVVSPACIKYIISGEGPRNAERSVLEKRLVRRRSPAEVGPSAV